MANNEIKTNAEIYREQRKERLAKAAKKKSNGKVDKAVRIIVKVICIVLAVALVLFGALKMLTEVFCVPQKVLTAATYADEKITVAEYNYYYMALYNQAVSISQQYDQQYQGMGSQYFDTTVSPSEQEYTGEDAGEDVETWADYFRYCAHERAFLIKTAYNDAMSEEAKKAGFSLTDEQKKTMEDDIKENIETLSEYAKNNDYALDNYIAKTQGEGLNEKLYKELCQRDYIAQYYLEWYQQNAADEITDKDVAAYYKEHRAEIDNASIRYFTVSYASTDDGSGETYTKKEAKSIADKFKAEAKNEKSFVAAAKKYAPKAYKDAYADNSATLAENLNKTSLSSISEELADWVMSTKRKAGNISVFDAKEQEAYYVIMITAPAHKNTSTAGADVRHLLVQAETTAENSKGETVSLSKDKIDQNFATAKNEAETLLKQWEDAGATEEKFIEFVKKHTDDTASAETGGLYEDITSESNYVPEFLNWALAKHKKGDTGLVKTDYGYHIMYYVGAEETQKWESDIRAAISQDAYNTYVDELYEDISTDAKLNKTVVDFFADRIEKVIDRNVANAAAYSSQYSY